MAVATSTALIISAAIGAVAAKSAADKQKKATEAAQRRTEEANTLEQERLAKIEEESKPTELTAEGIKFGTQDDSTKTGGVEDFLVKKTTSQLGATGASGLGFAL